MKGTTAPSCGLAGAGGALLRPEGAELGLELGLHKTRVLGGFELEGVCRLPDQSPPGAGDGVPGSEEAASWRPSGWGSRKRLLSPEDTECEAKRACEPRGEAPEARGEARSPGNEEPWVLGSTPPPGRAVRSGLSARGLQALTQSPLLLPGRTPAAQGTAAPGPSRHDQRWPWAPPWEEGVAGSASEERRPAPGRLSVRQDSFVVDEHGPVPVRPGPKATVDHSGLLCSVHALLPAYGALCGHTDEDTVVTAVCKSPDRLQRGLRLHVAPRDKPLTALL
ncbi:uncharacterized protein LOC123651419 [Pipistrellus kuhlii]|uniref:Uncharacterized protein n=1 Tax=Pipistrellus kuhlii TaxID=59472 RepID=A0A7J7S5I6_PIPKU|nr:uncharacterized protein LOC123651419 [Pipistrellus kuhlii]KAF6283507.1 hypothetical protein mPipKuh1_010173 [Pipistrellus kuhlii]